MNADLKGGATLALKRGSLSVDGLRSRRLRALLRTSLRWRRRLCYTAVVFTFLGVAGLLSRISAAQSATSTGVLLVTPVRLTALVKAAG